MGGLAKHLKLEREKTGNSLDLVWWSCAGKRGTRTSLCSKEIVLPGNLPANDFLQCFFFLTVWALTKDLGSSHPAELGRKEMWSKSGTL